MSLDIRFFSWFAGNLSWAFVLARVAEAFSDLGHNTYFASTNGINNTDDYINEERMLKSILALNEFGPGKKAINIDLTYTIPLNFPKRFLANSKAKCCIYNYETDIFPSNWAQYYYLADYYFPSSNFSAEIFYKNGVPLDKIFVVPHGIDTNMFSPNIPSIKLKTDKKFKFCSIVAPHQRKHISEMLNAYCENFSAKDDVALVLKTKIFKHSDGIWDATKNPNGRKSFEIILGDVFKQLHKKFGKSIPSIEIIDGHVKNVASIYNACDCNISSSGAEGNYMPGLESFSCGLLNIAPRYSGHLDYMNDENSLLCDVFIRRAEVYEQYWQASPDAIISEIKQKHFKELMWCAVKEHDVLIEKFKPNMNKIVAELSWKNVAQRIIDITERKINPYIPGTYVLPRLK